MVVAARETEIFGSVQPNYYEGLRFIPDIKIILANNPPRNHQRKFSLQINAYWKSTELIPKPSGAKVNGAWKSSERIGVQQNGSLWVTLEDVSLEAIAEFIKQGYILRDGVKLGGTSYIKNYQYSDFIYFDVDVKDWTIQQSIDNADNLPTWLIYGTPSYTEEWQKHRIFSILSERIDNPAEKSAILEYYLEKFNYLDPACKDPARIMYGSLSGIFYNNLETGFVDVYQLRQDEDFQRIYDNLLKGTKFNLSKKVSEFRDGKEFVVREEKQVKRSNKKKEKGIQADDLQDKLIEILANYENDFNEFCSDLGLEYEFNWQEINPDDSAIIVKWVGSNPFSATNKSGTSLVCSIKDNKFLFYNRAGSHDELIDGCSLYDFIHCCNTNQESLGKVLETANKEFKSICRSICTQFNLPLYLGVDVKKTDLSTLLHAYIHPQIEGQIYRYTNADNDLFYVYNDVEKHWERTTRKGKICSRFEQIHQQIFGKPFLSSKHNQMLAGAFEDFPLEALKYSEIYDDLTRYNFANGSITYDSKMILDYTPEIWNFWRSKIDYQESTGKGVQDLEACLMASGMDENDIDIVKKAFVITVHQKFHNVQKFLYFYGKRGSGKSVLSQIFTWIFPDGKLYSASSVEAEPLRIGTKIHRVTVWDEVTSFNKCITELMTIVRSSTAQGSTFTVRPLHQSSYSVTHPLTVILNGEQLNLGRIDDVAGFVDRVIPVKFKLPQSDQRSNLWADTFLNGYQDSESFKDLLRWAFEQPTELVDDWVAELKNLQHTNEGIKGRANDLLQNSDPFYSFVEFFDIDETGSVFYRNDVLTNIYIRCTNELDAAKKWRYIGRKIKSFYEDKPGFSAGRQGKSGIRGYYGLKLKPEFLEEYKDIIGYTNNGNDELIEAEQYGG